MHEFNVCQSIVDAVNNRISVREKGKPRVVRTTVVIGTLRPVVSEYLTFNYSYLTKGTSAEGSELVIRRPPATGLCSRCGSENMVTSLRFECRRCGSDTGIITGGRELYIDTIELQN